MNPAGSKNELKVARKLEQLGWTFVPCSELDRHGSDVLVESDVRSSLMRLNQPIEEQPIIADAVLTRLRDLCRSADRADLGSKNAKFTRWLKGDECIIHEYDRRVPIRLVDFENPDRNTFVVTCRWPFALTEERGRIDVLLLVNGIPLVTGSVGTRPDSEDPAAAKFDGESIIPQMFVPNLLSFRTDGDRMEYRWLGLPADHWIPWEADKAGDREEGRSFSMLRSCAVLSILKEYTAVENGVKEVLYELIPERVRIRKRFEQETMRKMLRDASRLSRGLEKRDEKYHGEFRRRTARISEKLRKHLASHEKHPAFETLNDKLKSIEERNELYRLNRLLDICELMKCLVRLNGVVLSDGDPSGAVPLLSDETEGRRRITEGTEPQGGEASAGSGLLGDSNTGSNGSMDPGSQADPGSHNIRDAVIDVALESWRMRGIMDKVLEKTDDEEQKRYRSRLLWYARKMDEALEKTNVRLVNVEGHPFIPGMAVTPLNIQDFDSNGDLIVDQMIEPIIMEDDSLVRMGTVTLRRAEP